MYEVTCFNKDNRSEFTRVFYDYNEMRKFLIKCKYSKRVAVSGWFKYC